ARAPRRRQPGVLNARTKYPRRVIPRNVRRRLVPGTRKLLHEVLDDELQRLFLGAQLFLERHVLDHAEDLGELLARGEAELDEVLARDQAGVGALGGLAQLLETRAAEIVEREVAVGGHRHRAVEGKQLVEA